MAAPNIVNVSSITGKTYSNVLTTSNVLHVVNAASSNQVYKINSILISNVDGVNTASATLEVNNAAGSGTRIRFLNTVNVPGDTTLVVVDKTNSFYLEENQSIKGLASADGDLEMLISYEIIS